MPLLHLLKAPTRQGITTLEGRVCYSLTTASGIVLRFCRFSDNFAIVEEVEIGVFKATTTAQSAIDAWINDSTIDGVFVPSK